LITVTIFSMKESKTVRVWSEIYAAFREVADQFVVSLGDLISTVLLAALEQPTRTLAEEISKSFEIRREEAERIIEELQINLLLVFSENPEVAWVEEVTESV